MICVEHFESNLVSRLDQWWHFGATPYLLSYRFCIDPRNVAFSSHQSHRIHGLGWLYLTMQWRRTWQPSTGCSTLDPRTLDSTIFHVRHILRSSSLQAQETEPTLLFAYCSLSFATYPNMTLSPLTHAISSPDPECSQLKLCSTWRVDA